MHQMAGLLDMVVHPVVQPGVEMSVDLVAQCVELSECIVREVRDVDQENIHYHVEARPCHIACFSIKVTAFMDHPMCRTTMQVMAVFV